VTGVIDGRRVTLGNRKLLEELDIAPGDLFDKAEAMRREGQTAMFVRWTEGGRAPRSG